MAIYKNMRITVEDILRYLASGMTVEEVLEDFPMLTQEDVEVAAEFAGAHPDFKALK